MVRLLVLVSYTMGSLWDFAQTGRVVEIVLEELKALYPSTVDWDVRNIKLSQKEQKEPWYRKVRLSCINVLDRIDAQPFSLSLLDG